MTITGTSKTRALATRYPVTDGITSETTTQEGHKEWLEPEEGTNVPYSKRRLIGNE